MFLQNGASIVVLKLGKEGAVFLKEGKSERVLGFRVERVADPIGAGDGFAAGFLSGLLDDLDLTHAVERANAVGALVTMVSGDVEGLPDKKEIESFIYQKDDDVIR